MAKKIKDYYDHEYSSLLAQKLSSVWPRFDSQGFQNYTNSQLETLEFHERQDLFSKGIKNYLDLPYSRVLEGIERILGPELTTDTGMFTHGWWLWPIGRYVQNNCLEEPEASYSFIYELTKRFTGEFAIRPLLDHYTQRTLEVALRWSRDPNVHVRRLASEGIRTRLPWAAKSTAALAYPDMYTEILSNLKEAPEKFVRKSVGNTLNDLFRDDPQLAKSIIRAWEQAADKGETLPKSTQWIIHHGMRGERKRGS